MNHFDEAAAQKLGQLFRIDRIVLVAESDGVPVGYTMLAQVSARLPDRPHGEELYDLARRVATSPGATYATDGVATTLPSSFSLIAVSGTFTLSPAWPPCGSARKAAR